MDTAKVFWTGRSQAVRLPKDYRIDTDLVRIRRHGRSVILEPLDNTWDWLDAIVGELDQDALEGLQNPVFQQDRPELDAVFK
jgi:antitoxin VapB